MANEQEPNLAPNILEYHGANVAFLDANYRGRLLGLPKEVLDQIKPYPPRVINIIVPPEQKTETITTATKSNQSSSEPKAIENNGLSKLTKGTIITAGILSAGGLGALANNYFNHSENINVTDTNSPNNINIPTKIDSEVGIEVN